MNRANYYNALRKSGIPGFKTLSQTQITGMEGILNAFPISGDGRIKTLAYGFATVRREVGSNMYPVREGFAATDAIARSMVRKAGRKYAKEVNGHVYYGRGYPQLTWFENYKKEGIQDNPDQALDPKWSAGLLFRGITDGRWNGQGKGLIHYLPNEGPDDLKNARRTVNITDHWQEIAEYYKQFMLAIIEAGGV